MAYRFTYSVYIGHLQTLRLWNIPRQWIINQLCANLILKKKKDVFANKVFNY